MNRKDKAKYMGIVLTDEDKDIVEVNSRINDCLRTINNMKLIWTKSDLTHKDRILLYKKIIHSKLVYGLEALQLNQRLKNKLSSFQHKTVRQMLNIPPTHIDREMTNEKIYNDIWET